MADGAGRQMQNLRGAGKAPLLRHSVKDAVFQQRHGFPPHDRFNPVYLSIHWFLL